MPATVMSTASLIALSAQATFWAPCICSASSSMRRRSSSGSPNRPPKGSSEDMRQSRRRTPGSLLSVPPMTPQQLRTRRQVESVIRIAAPALNLVLAVGERVSRLVEPEDHEYYPPRGGAARHARAGRRRARRGAAPIVSPAVNRQEQLGWEARVGRLAAVAAFVSALFSVISIALQTSIGGADDERDALLRVDEDGDVLLASLGAQSVAYALLAFVLYFLLRAAVARRPELPKALLPLVLLAPMLLIVGGFLTQLGVADVADEFVSSGARTESRAEDLLEDRAILGPILGLRGHALPGDLLRDGRA